MPLVTVLASLPVNGAPATDPLPALTGPFTSGTTISTTDGTWITFRNAAGSIARRWRNFNDGLIDGEMTSNLLLAIEDEGDQVRSEIFNTVMGVEYQANSAYSATITNGIVPTAYLGNANADPSGSTCTFTNRAIGVEYASRKIAGVLCLSNSNGRNIISVTAHIPDIVADPTGTALTIHIGSPYMTDSESIVYLFSGILPAGTVADFVIIFNDNPFFDCDLFLYSIDANGLAITAPTVVTADDDMTDGVVALPTQNIGANSIIIGGYSSRQGDPKNPTLTGDVTDIAGTRRPEQYRTFYNFNAGPDAAFENNCTWVGGPYDVTLLQAHWNKA